MEPKVIEIQNEKIYEFNSYENACQYLAEKIKNNEEGETIDE